MRNRLHSPFVTGRTSAGVAPGGAIDQSPGLRLALLFVGLAILMVVVAVRLTQVQSQLGESFAAAYQMTTERFESIPSTTGRILSSDGEVLAQDVGLFGVQVHYRWLEEPPDPLWLKQQVLSQLDRRERRPERIREGVKRLLAQRAEMWRRLSQVAGVSPEALAERRRGIQTRVERVLQKIAGSRTRQNAEAPPRMAAPGESWWRWAWSSAAAALTTSPERERDEPLIIQEQLQYHPIISEISSDMAAVIETQPHFFPGVRVALAVRRVYPRHDAAAHLIGYRTAISNEALADRRGRFPKGDPLDYRAGDQVGLAGLEQYYEQQLRGLRGEQRLVFNRRGELIHKELTRPPRFGQDLVLTLNLNLQHAAEQLLDATLQGPRQDELTGAELPVPRGGCIAAVDVRTGAVLAAAAAPRFDLNLLVNHDEAAWQRLVRDPRKPFFPRVSEMALPPGSVFKVLSAAAFLQSGRLDPSEHVYCQGFLDNPDAFRCYHSLVHGDVDLADALARSCNVYFFTAARRIGPDPIYEWGRRFGFGQPTGIDLPHENSGSFPVPAVPGRRPAKASGEALGLAIGQARLTATPLQIVRMMAAVANGGRLVTPHLVESFGPTVVETGVVQAAASEDLSPPEPHVIFGLSPATLRAIDRGLKRVVADPRGTGYKTVRIREMAIAGKTGTAETGGGREDHAWFAGYVPADRPKIAFVVVLEHAGSGGHAAGPVAREFVQAMLHTGVLHP